MLEAPGSQLLVSKPRVLLGWVVLGIFPQISQTSSQEAVAGQPLCSSTGWGAQLPHWVSLCLPG